VACACADCRAHDAILAIAATVPAGDVKGIWRKAVDAGLVADDENGYASVRGDLAALRRDGVAITPSRAVGRDRSRSKSAAWISRWGLL